MKKFWFVLPIVTSLASLGLICMVLWMLFYPYKTVEFQQPAKILTKEIKAGDKLKYEFVYNKYTNKPAKVYRFIINSVNIPVDQFDSNLLPGTGKITVSDFEVPMYIEPGKYRVGITVVYEVNSIRKIERTLLSEEFEIIK